MRLLWAIDHGPAAPLEADGRDARRDGSPAPRASHRRTLSGDLGRAARRDSAPSPEHAHGRLPPAGTARADHTAARPAGRPSCRARPHRGGAAARRRDRGHRRVRARGGSRGVTPTNDRRRTRASASARDPARGAGALGSAAQGAVHVKASDEAAPPRLSDEGGWYLEHAALTVTTLKWAVLGAVAGACVGWATRAFLWSLDWSSQLVDRVCPGGFHPYFLLPLALPLCVWLVRTFAPTARGHGTEGRDRRDPRAVGQDRLAGRARQAAGDRGDARLRGLRRQGGSLRADRRRRHEPVRRRAATRRRGSAPARDLRGRSRLRGGVRYARIGRALRDRGPLLGTHRVPGPFPLPGRRDRGSFGLRDERSHPGPPPGPVAAGPPHHRGARDCVRGAVRPDRARVDREHARARASAAAVRGPPLRGRSGWRRRARRLLRRGRVGVRGPREHDDRGVTRRQRARRHARVPVQDRRRRR